MKRFIGVVLFILIATIAYADMKGVKVGPNGASFPLGVDYDNTPNWDTAVSIVKADTGVDAHGTGFESCEVSINADITKFDIAECHYRIQGVEISFDPITAINPAFAAGEDSRFIGVTVQGTYTSQTSTWTSTQKRTIVPLARLNTPLGQLGPGSDIRLLRDDRYFLSERDYLDRLYLEEALGALYVFGGDIFQNATSGLRFGQYSGVLYDAQTKRHVLAKFENRSAIFLHLSSNEVDWVGEKKLPQLDDVNYNPPGGGLVPMQNDNTFKCDSILKSPKGQNGTQEGGLFIVYGNTEYATAAAAIAQCKTDFALFINQGFSGLVPVARAIVQKNAGTINTLIDVRPCLVCRP